MMKTYFLAWQDMRPGQQAGALHWYPIGRLQADTGNPFFRFDYITGMTLAQQQAGLRPLAAFPELGRSYVSGELFPIFQNRVMRRTREDYPAHVRRLGFDTEQVDPLDTLEVSGGKRATDDLEVFPKITTQADGSFSCRFFLHGWRYVNEGARQRIVELKPGELLQVSLELNNPATGPAIQLLTASDYYMLGWTPRYLVMDLIRAIGEGPTDIHAQVVRVNMPPAPRNQRVLVQLEGRFPAGMEPMASPDFEPLVATA